jgi:hypothetical protein
MTRGGFDGHVQIAVTVSPAGKALSVKLIKHPDLETAKFVAYLLVNTTYKPAVCGGQPCQMDFPFDVNLRLALRRAHHELTSAPEVPPWTSRRSPDPNSHQEAP